MQLHILYWLIRYHPKQHEHGRDYGRMNFNELEEVVAIVSAAKALN